MTNQELTFEMNKYKSLYLAMKEILKKEITENHELKLKIKMIERLIKDPELLNYIGSGRRG